MSNLLSRDAFRAASRQLKTKVVDVPELGGAVTVRSLKAGEAMELFERSQAGDKDAPLLYVLAAVVDENGQPMFDTLDEVKEMNMDTANKLGLEIAALFKSSTPEDAKKNSEVTPT